MEKTYALLPNSTPSEPSTAGPNLYERDYSTITLNSPQYKVFIIRLSLLTLIGATTLCGLVAVTLSSHQP